MIGCFGIQVNHTYGFLDGSYPLINEHQLGFAESTCSAKLVYIFVELDRVTIFADLPIRCGIFRR